MMRGLAFPPNADVDRETSHEYGTPISNVDDIPIDPALGGTVIDPALMMEGSVANGVQEPQAELPLYEHRTPSVDEFQLRQYTEVPEGDPFAQQIPTPYFPIPPQPSPQPKPKRKRKPRKDNKCSFCRGDETKNKLGQPETLLNCHECGRSGHPSCMQLERLTDVVRTYPWKCIECKNCEVCQEKGDDDRILFCDWCDRGWHLDCMVPPLEEPPDGEWHCPGCPPVGEVHMSDVHDQDHDVQHDPVDIETSTFSDPQSPVPSASIRKGRKKVNGRGRGRKLKVPDGSDTEEVVEVDDTPIAPSKARGRPRKSAVRPRPTPASSDEEEVVTFSVRPGKRSRPLQQRIPAPINLPRVRLRLPGQRGKGKEREEEESPHGLFDDILSPDERDTTKSLITNTDKLFFERSRIAAEEKLAPATQPIASSSSRTLDSPDDFISGRPRPLRSSTLQQSTPLPKRIDFSNSPGPSTPGGSSLTPVLKFEPGVLRIKNIRFGPYDIKTWYDAPFPEEYANIPDGRLWICEFCLKYMKSPFAATRHQMKCKARHPPGDEIYRDGSVSIFEVDGRRNKIYCQNLCLLSKMFLDHKSLFYDVEPFLFYVLTHVDEFGARFVGYFSKEKRCPKDYNLSCIMTLPVRQRQGWGNLLIDFSYLLSKIEQRLGSPEKPLSTLGAIGYKNYWILAVVRFLQSAPDNVKLEDICSATSMTMEDVCNTLNQQNMIFIREPTPPLVRPSPGQSIKFSRGRKNGLARRQLQRLQTQDKETSDGPSSANGDFIPPKNYEIHFDRERVNEYLKKWEAKGYVKLRAEKLQWMPYLTTRIPQEANLPVLPAMDTAIDESSKANSTQPTTPAPLKDGSTESHLSEDFGREDDELPSAIDDFDQAATKSSTKDWDAPVLRSTRSRRGTTPPSVSTPSTTSRSLRTRSSTTNDLPPQEETAAVHLIPRGVKLPSGKVEMITNDEAFAAKLAMEEQLQQGRQLRSRRSECHSENKRPVPSVPPLKTVSSRKRRRVDSSPELVEVPTPSEPPDEQDISQEDGDGGEMDIDLPPPMNGNHVNGCHHLAAVTQAEEDVTSVREILEVKSEGAVSPLTDLTSRQCVSSDDTVYMEEDAGKLMHFHESDLRSTLVGTEGGGGINLDDCHDEDADGEFEEDAEGEPDWEVEGLTAY